MNMLAIRMAQAGLAARIWDSLKEEVGPELAATILTKAIRADAKTAGEDFARHAPGGPNLKHFATVLERWREGDALAMDDVNLTDSSLSFSVTNCAYARAYADMGLEPELGFILSCSRDEPFARAYSPCLSMRRSETIMQGATRCMFSFSWNEHSDSL